MVLSCLAKVDMAFSVRVSCASKVGSSSSTSSILHNSAAPAYFVHGASVWTDGVMMTCGNKIQHMSSQVFVTDSGESCDH